MNNSTKHILIISVLFLLMLGVVNTVSATEWSGTADQFLANLTDNITDDSTVIITESNATVNKEYIINQNNITITTIGKVTFKGNTSGHFNITGNNITLNGITFRDFQSNGDGGVITWMGDKGTIISCQFINNRANNGGAIYIATTINNWIQKNCTFTQNQAEICGGAIHVYSTVDNWTQDNCTFNNNNAQVGGGAIYIDSTINNWVQKNCVFAKNTVGTYYSGGAIYIYSTINNWTQDNCTFTQNQAGAYGGAIFVSSSENWIQKNCTFTQNQAGAYGGAIHVYSTVDNWTQINCTFKNNNVEDWGGAIFVSSTINNWIQKNCTFTQNQAGAYGGAIYTYSSNKWTQTNCNFKQNIADVSGGAIDIYSAENLTQINCTFTESNATYGGGVIYVSSTINNWIQKNCTFTQNNAPTSSGGAIYIYSTINNWTQDNCNFKQNTALIDGGAIYIYSANKWTQTNCNFENNSGMWGGAIYVYSKINNWTQDNCTFQNNTDIYNVDIYNVGTITISGNSKALIYNTGTITNPLTVIILGNDTIGVVNNKDFNLTAFIKCGNYTIIGSDFNFTINNTQIIANLVGDHYTANYHVTGITGDEILVNGCYGYNGTSNYQTAILIIKTGVSLTGYNVYKEFENGTQYQTILKNINGNPLSNRTISIAISSSKWSKNAFYWIVTNKDGVATLEINLLPNEYVITALYGDEITVNNITVVPSNLKLQANDLVKYFMNNSQYTVKVTDADGNPAVNKTVTITIYKSAWKSPVNYYAKTNSNGVATLNINLIAGTYSVTSNICYNSTKTSITVLSTLTANNLVKKVNKADNLKAKLVDGQGKPASEKEVTFTVKDKTYYLTTDANGIATLPIHLSLGTWNFLIAYPDTGATTKATVKVVK